MCHFPARGEKSKETKFLELCCKENNSSAKDWSHIFRLDTVVREMSEGKTALFTFLPNFKFYVSGFWVTSVASILVWAAAGFDSEACNCTQTTTFKVKTANGHS